MDTACYLVVEDSNLLPPDKTSQMIQSDVIISDKYD